VEPIARIDDLPGMLKRLSALPKTAQAEIRAQAQAIADEEAVKIRTAAVGSSAQAAAVAPFIKARRDRVPAIVAGGPAKAKVSGGATRGEIFFGAEFGGQARKTTMQFRPHKGREGYFFYPQLRQDSDRMVERWLGVVRAVEREWSQHG